MIFKGELFGFLKNFLIVCNLVYIIRIIFESFFINMKDLKLKVWVLKINLKINKIVGLVGGIWIIFLFIEKKL